MRLQLAPLRLAALCGKPVDESDQAVNRRTLPTGHVRDTDVGRLGVAVRKFDPEPRRRPGRLCGGAVLRSSEDEIASVAEAHARVQNQVSAHLLFCL